MLAEIEGLAGIDKIIVMIYMAGVLFIGTYLGKYVKSGSDLFLAGKSLPFWAIGMSIVVSDIGATDFVATAGGGYTDGLTQANYDWLGSMPAMLLAAFIFIPYYWRTGAYTVPEFLGKRYNAGVRVVEASLWLAFLGIMLALMLWVTAVLMKKVLGWDEMTAIWVTAVVVGIYTVSGGLTAVVMTDVLQTVVMFIGGAALVILCVIKAGGISGIQATVLAYGDEFQDHFRLVLPHDTTTAFPWSGIVLGLGIVLSTGYMAGNQAVVQRCLGARSEWDAKAAMIFAAFLKLFIPLLVVLPGLAALALNPGMKKVVFDVPAEFHTTLDQGVITEPLQKLFSDHGFALGDNPGFTVETAGSRWVITDQHETYTIEKGEEQLDVRVPTGDEAVPWIIAEVLPPGLKGLMFAAFFAALMSSVDSYLNSCSTIFVRDIYGTIARFANHPPTPHFALILGRCVTVVLIIGAAVFAPSIEKVNGLYSFIQTLLSYFQGPTLAILALGILWHRTNGWGALAGLITGVGLSALMLEYKSAIFTWDDPFLFVAWWTFLATLLVTVVVSLLTPPEPAEKLRGMVWGHVMHDTDAQEALRNRTAS